MEGNIKMSAPKRNSLPQVVHYSSCHIKIAQGWKMRRQQLLYFGRWMILRERDFFYPPHVFQLRQHVFIRCGFKTLFYMNKCSWECSSIVPPRWCSVSCSRVAVAVASWIVLWHVSVKNKNRFTWMQARRVSLSQEIVNLASCRRLPGNRIPWTMTPNFLSNSIAIVLWKCVNFWWRTDALPFSFSRNISLFTSTSLF